jgi:hypothetical protein
VVLSHEGGVNFNPDRPIERNGRDGNPLRGLAGEGYSRGLFAQSLAGCGKMDSAT